MQALTRNATKLRRHTQDGSTPKRQPRPAARRQVTKAAAIRVALREQA